MHPKIRVLVFDDETFVQKRLRKLLATAGNIRLVGEMTELSQLLTYCLALQPQVVLLGSGLKPFIFDLAAAIQQVAPQAKMIALLNEHEPLRAEALLATNLAGCLFRQEINDHLLPTIYAVTQGAVAFSHAVMARMVAPQLTNPPTAPKEPVTPPALTRARVEQ